MNGHITLTFVPPSTVILMGIPGLDSIFHWVSIPFCFMYVVALLGNFTMIYLIVSEPRLHEPMYYFLCILSVTDLMLSSTILPKTLAILLLNAGRMTFMGCITQTFFVHFYFLLESVILLSMAFDRYVAICKPLRFTTILTNKMIGNMALFCVTRSITFVAPGIYLKKNLKYCGNKVIHHSYCENMAVAKLACGDISSNSVYGITAAFLTTGLDFVFIIVSYVLILRAVFALPSKDAHLKALSTCAAHVCIILISYILAFFSFFIHRLGMGIPPYIHILLANLYIEVPPMLIPVVYGVNSKAIRTSLKRLFQWRSIQP